MLLVHDKSGSMTVQPLGFSTDLWSATTSALIPALDAVKGVVSFGLVLFPDAAVSLECSLETCCLATTGNEADVAIADGVVSVPQIVEMLSVTAPGGGTPAAAGLRRALDYYTTGAGAALEGDKFVMFITDGGPNCNPNVTCDATTCTVNLDGRCQGTANCCTGEPRACLDDAETLNQIRALAAAGVDTFVVGLPGTEAYGTYLSEFAVAGGRPNTGGATPYYTVSATGGVSELAAVFTQITTQLVTSCDFVLARFPPDPVNLNVAVNCELLPRAWDSTPGEWELDLSTDPPTVRILGDACAFLTYAGAERIDVRFGCPHAI